MVKGDRIELAEGGAPLSAYARALVKSANLPLETVDMSGCITAEFPLQLKVGDKVEVLDADGVVHSVFIAKSCEVDEDYIEHWTLVPASKDML